MNTCAPEYFSAATIALAMSTTAQRVHKRTVQRLAQREGWPSRRVGNRFEYRPPQNILEVLVAAPVGRRTDGAPTVRFVDLVQNDAQHAIVLLRKKAVDAVQAALHLGKERALQFACAAMKKDHPLFRCSVTSLRRWFDNFAAHGLDALVEQKRGRVGRRAFAADLDEQTILQARAAAVEHGIKGRLNLARGYRNAIVSNPLVEGPARNWAHGAHASKSYVPPSVRDAMRTPELATRYLQIGAKAARLDGPYTEGKYDNLPAGRAFTADDMTANCYVWTPWPNENGFLIIRPQILAVMDIGSLRWLNFRAIIRPKGQYNKDDVWGLIGDYLDGYGLHVGVDNQVDTIAVLEGGTWQSNVIIGQRTGCSDEQRMGGLKSLGVKVVHTRTPRGKIIEGCFNTLQHAADNVRGFCGRMEMKDCPESVKAQLAEVKAGKAHPRQYFLSLAEYTDHLAGVMAELNNERSDGKVCRGLCPNDKWQQDAPVFAAIPDNAKWLYRSAYVVREVTRNGLRITVGSGKFQSSYTYAHPALEAHRGRRVVCYWNDSNPDTPAVIYSLDHGRPKALLCVAPRLKELDRFGASDEDLKAEATRKKLAMQMCVSHSRTLAPYLQRQAAPAPVGESAPQLTQDLAAARAAQAEKEAAQTRTRRAVVDAARELTPADAEAALALPQPDGDRFSAEEIADIFQTD